MCLLATNPFGWRTDLSYWRDYHFFPCNWPGFRARPARPVAVLARTRRQLRRIPSSPEIVLHFAPDVPVAPPFTAIPRRWGKIDAVQMPFFVSLHPLQEEGGGNAVADSRFDCYLGLDGAAHGYLNAQQGCAHEPHTTPPSDRSSFFQPFSSHVADKIAVPCSCFQT